MTKRKEKKLQVEDCTKIEVTIPFYLTMDPRRKNNLMHMTFSDMRVTFNDSETGEELGETRGCLGGSMEIMCGRYQKGWGRPTWMLRPTDLFDAVSEAAEKYWEEHDDTRPD